jgi:phytanoyl-CoA hydroxylase
MKRKEQKVFSLDKNLKEDHINFFQKNGFIQFKTFIDKQTVLLLIKEIENVQQFLIKNNFKKVNGIPLKFGLDENNSLFRQVRFVFLFLLP